MSMENCREQLIADFYGHGTEPPEALLQCMEQPPTPSKYLRAVLLMLRTHYSDPSQYGPAYDHLACYKWSPDEKDSTLHVGLAPIDDKYNPENYPGIYVRLGGVQYAKAAIGDYAGLSCDYGENFVTKLAEMKIGVVHVAREVFDAYDLAAMSSVFFTALAAPTIDMIGATKLEVGGFSEGQRIQDSPKQNYAVELSLALSYNFAVSRSMESHRIRKIVSGTEPTTDQEP